MPLGRTELHIGPITNGAMKAQKLLLDLLPWNAMGDTVGEQYYAGLVAFGEQRPVEYILPALGFTPAAGLENDERTGWEIFLQWLNIWTDPPLTMDDLDGGSPDETIAAINAVFEVSGISWLGRSLGNQATVRRIAMRQLDAQQTTSPSTQTNDSIGSTNSSSTSQDPPLTPESMSPATG